MLTPAASVGPRPSCPWRAARKQRHIIIGKLQIRRHDFFRRRRENKFRDVGAESKSNESYGVDPTCSLNERNFSHTRSRAHRFCVVTEMNSYMVSSYAWRDP